MPEKEYYIHFLIGIIKVSMNITALEATISLYPCYVDPCHHGMGRPLGMEGSCEDTE
jgi:hypothetical protein